MCGLVGFVTKRNSAGLAEVLDCMTDAISHRGPDDKGVFIECADDANLTVGLGHRRLSIIDLSSHSHQPIEQDDAAMVFNGEIYNYIELREELKRAGHIFESSGDTEVALASYKEWGVDCFRRFNGMWAIAILDKKNGELILSRDRFGKKPLYYYKDDDAIIFASEIKSIFLYPGVLKKPNFEKIYRYLSTIYRYVDIDNASFFENIFSVPKSSYMRVSHMFETIVEPFWTLEEGMVDLKGNELSIIDDFRELFIDSVKLRLRSDVPVGCMLSGGMDSTSIACVAYKILKTPILTFSGITGDERGVYDESEYIDEVVKETSAEHKYVKPEPSDLFDSIDEMLFFHDEPICTVTWYSLYRIAEKIKEQGLKVVLNGHGGDEMLGGYWDHYHYNFFDLETSGNADVLDYEQKMWLKNHNRKISEICQTREYIKKLQNDEVSEISKFTDYSDCFTLDFVEKYKRTINLYSGFASTLSKRLHKELMYEGVPAIVKPEDRNTMAHSIESRSPMLDYRLAEFCFSLPNSFKIRDGIGKWTLREAMRDILPEKVRTRKDKAGFIAPADVWFRTTNRDDIQKLIDSDFIKEAQIFDMSRLNEIFKEHLTGIKNHQMFLWQFINFALWYKMFFAENR